MVFANQFYVFHENHDFRFSVWLIHFIIKSCSGSRVPRQKALISIRNGDRAGGATPTRPSTDSPLSSLQGHRTHPYEIKVLPTPRRNSNAPNPQHSKIHGEHEQRMKSTNDCNKSVEVTENNTIYCQRLVADAVPCNTLCGIA